MVEYIIAFAIVAAGALALLLIQGRFSTMERRHLWAGLAAYLFAAVFKIWLIVEYYGGTGDMMMYHRVALGLTNLLQQDPAVYVPEMLRLFFQLETQTHLDIFGYGTSTASMSAILALLFWIFGDSLHIVSLFLGVLSFFASVAMYWAFRQTLTPEYRRGLLWACILLPSGVFWTGGFSKELFSVMGLGLGLLGCYYLFIRRYRWFWGVTLTIVGVGLVTLFKGYLLFGLVAGFAGFYYAARRRRVHPKDTHRLAPLYFLVAIAVVLVGIIALGELFPQFSPEAMAEEMAHGQEAGARGGSAIEMGDPAERSLAGQLAFAPIAVLNTLFRPLIFEAHNAVSLFNAVEMTVLTVLLAFGIKWVGVRRTLRLMMRSPVLLGCFSAVLILSVGIGLASANLGTLSRYRAPLMPFWVVIITVLFTYGRTLRGGRVSGGQT